jgi:hypothetical protein
MWADSITPRPFQVRGDGHCYQLSTNLLQMSGIAQKKQVLEMNRLKFGGYYVDQLL